MTQKKVIDWRRTPPRYEVNWLGRATQDNQVWSVKVKNISQGGLLITIPKEAQFLADMPTTITLSYDNRMVEFEGELVHYNLSRSAQLFGFQFVRMTPENEAVLSQWISKLETSNVARYPKRPGGTTSLLSKVKRFFNPTRKSA